MARKRMFSILIVDSDAFLDMPLSTQALYFHLNMRADDDGFIGNAKRIQRMIGSSDDDLKILIGKRFLIPFEDGVLVIKHWRIHNTIQSDRYTPTVYTEEKLTLCEKDNKAYTLGSGNSLETKWKQNDNTGLGLDIDLDIDLDKEIEKNKEICVENSVSESPTFPPDGFEMICVDKLISSIVSQFQGAKVPNTTKAKIKWCEYVEKMKRIDHRTEAEINEVLKFATTDQFWKTNIRSTKKLREKFDTLIMQARKPKQNGSAKNKPNQFQQFPQRENIDYDAMVLEQLKG